LVVLLVERGAARTQLGRQLSLAAVAVLGVVVVAVPWAVLHHLINTDHYALALHL